MMDDLDVEYRALCQPGFAAGLSIGQQLGAHLRAFLDVACAPIRRQLAVMMRDASLERGAARSMPRPVTKDRHSFVSPGLEGNSPPMSIHRRRRTP